MPSIKNAGFALALLLTGIAAPAMAQESNKDLVVKALTEVFINTDPTAIDRYWAEDYIQHNPMFPSGRAVIRKAFSHIPPGFKYEMGMVIAEGDLVAVHGRYTGVQPKPIIVVDIFRVADGKIVEHWDVAQEEVVDTVSGNPMFEPKP